MDSNSPESAISGDVLNKDIEKGEMPGGREAAETPPDTPTSSPTKREEEFDGVDTTFDRNDAGEMDLTRTKSSASIAETMPLSKEIVFVATICMAQVLTRNALLFPLLCYFY